MPLQKTAARLLGTLYEAYFNGAAVNFHEWAEKNGVEKDEAVRAIAELRANHAISGRAGGGLDLLPKGIVLAEAEAHVPEFLRGQNEDARFRLVDALENSEDRAAGRQLATLHQLAKAIGITRNDVARHSRVLAAQGFFESFQLGQYRLTQAGEEWVSKERVRRRFADEAEARKAKGVPTPSISRDEMKFGVLRALTDKPMRQHHKLTLVGNANSPGPLEQRLFKRAFDPDERVLAEECISELQRSRFVRATFGSIRDGEKWIEITDAGLRTLERGVLDDLDEALRRVDPRLVEIRRGAWSALYSGGSDSFRQAAHSGRELIDQLLHAAAPDMEIRAEPAFVPDKDDPTKIRRRHRLKFIMRKARAGISETDFDVAEKAIDYVYAVHKKLVDEAHSRDNANREDVEGCLRAAENALRILLIP